jgi:hypothetical protein
MAVEGSDEKRTLLDLLDAKRVVRFNSIRLIEKDERFQCALLRSQSILGVRIPQKTKFAKVCDMYGCCFYFFF